MSDRPAIPFHRPDYGPEEEAAVVAVLRSGATGGGGAVGERVERALAALAGCRHALLVSSCTHAMEAALSALGVGAGDEVVVPGFTYVSAATAVERQGALPVFVDVERERFGLDPALLEAAIGPRTRAVLPVHYAGRACRMDEIMEIARRHGIAVIEDAAHAIGSTDAHGRALGTIGDVGCVSFQETKNLSCGEGGALLTDDDALAARLESFRDKGTNRAACMRGEIPHYTWVSPGSSLSLSELQAAVLEVQLGRIDALGERRAAIAAAYRELLSPLVRDGRVEPPAELAPGERFNWHLYPLLLPTHVDRDAVGRAMRARGVATAAHFQPLDGSPRYRELAPDARPDLSVTHEISRRVLRLPIYPSLTDADVERVVRALDEALRDARDGAP